MERLSLSEGIIWLSDQFSRKVISPQKHLPNNAHVCALIDEDGPCWLEDRVREELLPHEANAVLRIPLSTRRPEDSLIWQRTKNGIYSTKSAYWMLAESTALSNPGPSPQQQIVGFGRIPGASESHIKLNISCGEPVVKLCLRRRTSSVTMSLAMLHVSVVTGKRRMLSTLYGIARFSKRFGGKLNTTEAISLAILQVSEIFHFHEHPILQKF